MYRRLNDLRFLRVAALLEQVLEAYEEYLRSLVPYGSVRRRLDPLFGEGPGHLELKRSIARMEAEAKADEASVTPSDALQSMLDCESFAHDFYLSALDRLSDPRLVRLFRALADEERQHMGHVAVAMELLGRLQPKAAAAGRKRT